MGVQISDIIPKKEVELAELSGKKIAIDAYNSIYAFLSIIRDRMTGEPLKDSAGNVTSHLSGLFYRNANLIENGIKPVWVFDGKPPKFKKKTIEARQAAKEEAEKKWKEALERGEEAIVYAQASSKLTDKMAEDSKKLLELMGIPWIQAESEGEAQCAFMCKNNSVDFTGSQDFDSLLFGSPMLVRNLSISGRRKVPRKEMYIEIKPEIIELEEALASLGIKREQLILMGILIGTDYNAGGVEKFGPKRSLELVKNEKTFENVMKKIEWKFDVDAREIYNFFISPPVTEKYKIEFKEPDNERIIKFMTDEHDFSKERIEKVIEALKKSFSSGAQSTLKGWLK